MHFCSHAMDAAPTESMRSKTSRRMNVCEEPSVKKRHATKRYKNASSAVNRDLSCKKGVFEDNGALDEAGVVFWQREGGVDTRFDSQNLGAVKNRSKPPREGLGKRGPRPKGGAALVKSHVFLSIVVGVQN